MKHNDLIETLRHRLLKVRATLRYVEGRRFQVAFDGASVDDQLTALHYTISHDKPALVAWTQAHIVNNLDLLAMKSLRQIARQLNISCHRNISRDMLITQIRRANDTGCQNPP